MSFPNTPTVAEQLRTAAIAAIDLLLQHQSLGRSQETTIEALRPLSAEVERLKAEVERLKAERDEYKQKLEGTRESQAYKDRRKAELEAQQKNIDRERTELGLAVKTGV